MVVLTQLRQSPTRKASFQCRLFEIATASMTMSHLQVNFIGIQFVQSNILGGSLAGSSVKHSREPSTNTTTSRVHSTANNITYVEVDAAGNPPDSPTPDYEDEVPDFGVALRNQLAQTPTTYQTTGQFRQR